MRNPNDSVADLTYGITGIVAGVLQKSLMKNIIICADDYAQNEPISRAILDLVAAGRLSAVSCMTASNHWYTHGKALQALANGIDVGLHFDITHFNPVRPFSFPRLLLASYLNRIDLDVIEQRLIFQLDEFEKIMGRAPDYIDGHQHVHILPNVRLRILKLLKDRYGSNLPYLRQVNPAIFRNASPFKSMVLRLLAVGFNAVAKKQGFKFPPYFFGIYSLNTAQYGSLFKTWLSLAPAGSLIMCHPGLPSNDLSDPIKNTRPCEYHYLASEQFLQDVFDNHIQISRWKVISLAQVQSIAAR